MDSTQARPVVLGLTGGIGTGKSNVLSVLVSLGAVGVDADAVTHAVIEPDGPAYGAVLDAFGPDILLGDGSIDRQRLGQRVFADPSALARLEAIVHPAVAAVIAERTRVASAPMVAIEAIKLLEAGLSRALCDTVWVTYCSPRRQMARLREARDMTPVEVRRRVAAQMPPAEMAAHADRVILTDGTRAETGLQVLAGWTELGLAFPAADVRRGEVADAEGIAAVLNAVVKDGGTTAIDRTYTPAQERAFLRRMPPQSRLIVALVGSVLAGFQVVEPYATYTRAMAHVATIGTYVAPQAQGSGLGSAMSVATFDAARAAGFTKLVAAIRADNGEGLAFYQRIGFRACGRLSEQVATDLGMVDQLLYERFL